MADAATTQPMMTVQQPLAPTGQHDSHLYDPNARQGDDHRLIAVYETVAAASAARSRLQEQGVPPAAIHILDRTGEKNQDGWWASLRRFLIPDEDAHGYAESIQRGHAVLLVRPDHGSRVAVIRTLEASGPIDFDARLAEWRSAGWQDLAARQVNNAGMVPDAAADRDYARSGGFTGGTFTGTDTATAAGTYRGPDSTAQGQAARRLAGDDYRLVRGYGLR